MILAAQNLHLSWLMLLSAAVFNSAGTLLLKQSRIDAAAFNVFGVSLSPWMILGLLAYALNFVLFARALSRLPISIAYPAIVGCSFAIIALLSPVLFGERFSALHLVGCAAILTGVATLARL